MKCAPSHHFGAENLKIALPLNLSGGSLTMQANGLVYSCSGQTDLSSTIFSALAALLIKTRFDSCHVLSAGWPASVCHPSAV